MAQTSRTSLTKARRTPNAVLVTTANCGPDDAPGLLPIAEVTTLTQGSVNSVSSRTASIFVSACVPVAHLTIPRNLFLGIHTILRTCNTTTTQPSEIPETLLGADATLLLVLVCADILPAQGTSCAGIVGQHVGVCVGVVAGECIRAGCSRLARALPANWKALDPMALLNADRLRRDDET